MKRFVAAVAAIVFLAGLPAAPLQSQTKSKVPAVDAVLSPAIQAAKAKNKIVFVHFGASWCKWCKELDAMLHGPELGGLMADYYVFASLTVQESDDKKALENPGAQDYMTRMGGGKTGVPYYVFLDKDGNKVVDSNALPDNGNIGYPATVQEIQAFAGLIARTAPRMTSGERARVTDYLTKHAPPH